MGAEELTEVDGLDPNQALDVEDYEDPSPEEITDEAHPDYCEPAVGVEPVAEEEDGDE